MHRQRAVFFVGVFALAWLPSSEAHAQAGGIEVFAAETLFADGWRLSETHLYQRNGTVFSGSSKAADPQDRLFEEHRAVTGIDYGLLPSFTLSALVPVVYKRMDRALGSGRETQEAFGLGDVSVLGKYRIYKTDWKRSAFHVGLIAGLELPTGQTDADEDGVRLSPGLQPGSGSFDPFTALALNMDLYRWRFDALCFYKANTEGTQDFEAGDFFALEFDAAYRFWHTKYPGPTASARLGIQWRRQGRDEMGGLRLVNSGSDEIVLRSGLSFHPIPSMDLSIALDVPIYRDVNGTQLGRDFRSFFAIGFRF